MYWVLTVYLAPANKPDGIGSLIVTIMNLAKALNQVLVVGRMGANIACNCVRVPEQHKRRGCTVDLLLYERQVGILIVIIQGSLKLSSNQVCCKP